MHKFWLIFQQAFWMKARTKAFVITTILLAIGIIGLANAPILMKEARAMLGMDHNEEEVLVVSTTSDEVYERFVRTFGEEKMTVKRATASKDQLNKKVLEQKIEGYVVIEDNNPYEAHYVSSKMTDFVLPTIVQETVQQMQAAKSAEMLQLTEAQLASLTVPVTFTKENISATAKSEKELQQATILVYFIMFVIYFAVIMYSGWIAAEVAQEKSSRVMEILISSVSPTTHMFAKILGIGTLGILQLGFLGTLGYVVSQRQSFGEMGNLFSFSEVSTSTWIYGFVFFILGYFLYATLAALLGSLVSRTEDAQQLIMPMTLLIIAAFMISVFGMNNPDATWMQWASYFPFFTPLVMFLRVGLLDLPMWEPLLAIFLMLLTIVLLGIFGARVYRGGVLMYGPSRSLKDIRRALRLGKE